MRWYSYLRALSAVALLGAAGFGAWTQRDRWAAREEPHTHAASPPAVTVQSVKLSEEAMRGLDLQSRAVQLEDYQKVIEMPGVVTDVPGRARVVSAPAAGVVTKVHVSLGQAVRPGDPLYTLQLASEFVQSTQTDLARSAKDLMAATARRDLTAKLVAGGTKPGQDLIDDEIQVRRLTTQVEGHRRQLLVFGLNPGQVKRAEAGDFVTEIVIVTPAEGTATPTPPGAATPYVFEVEAIAVAQGQGVSAGQLLARLADHRELLIEGHAFETEAAYVTDATGDGRQIGVDFLDPAPKPKRASESKLVIRSVGKTDPATRTFPFYVALANEVNTYERGGKTYFAWKYLPGRQVRLRVPTGTISQVIVLPTDAIVREGPDAFVFRQNGDMFDRKAVVIVAEDRLLVAIAPGNGVESGVAVLRNNAAAVNRALKAAQARSGTATGGKKGHWHADGTFHEEKD